MSNKKTHHDLPQELIETDKYKRAAKQLKDTQEATLKGIQMAYTVRTSKDERVCSDCKSKEGNNGLVDNSLVVGIDLPPFYKGCRCRTRYSIHSIRK